MTAPSENKLLVVRLPSGRVMRQLEVSGEPQYVAEAGLLVVVSASWRTVSLINPESLRLVKRFHGFAAPHIVAVSPDGEYAYVTDNATGRVTAIGLYDQKVMSSLIVGHSAHHLAFSPNARQVWIALGESAPSVAVLRSPLRQPGLPESSPALDYAHPHLAGRFDPGFLAHDLQFSPDSKEVWITSADTDDVGVFGARTRRLLFRVPVGAPPQHVAIAGRYAYLTSGYGSRIEQVGLSTGRVIRRAWVPYGTFELATVGRYVVAVSLLRGTLAICNRELRLLRVVHLAPSLEDVIPYSP